MFILVLHILHPVCFSSNIVSVNGQGGKKVVGSW